jgi:hypothetical protein
VKELGSVFNLLNQISSGKLFMVGKDQNKKSIAYIGNIVVFLETFMATEQKCDVYNHVDGSNLTMNVLVSQVRDRLKGKIASVRLYVTGWISFWDKCRI